MDYKAFQAWIIDKATNIEQVLVKNQLTLERQQVILEEHHRRSLANEEALELMRLELSPVKTHVAIVNNLAKVFVVLVGFAGTAFGILKLYRGF